MTRGAEQDWKGNECRQEGEVKQRKHEVIRGLARAELHHKPDNALCVILEALGVPNTYEPGPMPLGSAPQNPNEGLGMAFGSP